jgi:uncharacterized protein YhfF
MSDGENRVLEFAFPGPIRNDLVARVLSGEKTATTSLLVEWEVENEPLPTVGERQTVVDSAGNPAGVIELLAVEVIRLGDADSALAFDEGEGYRSVAEWRTAHEQFWSDEIFSRFPDQATVLSDDTQVVVERFRLVE